MTKAQLKLRQSWRVLGIATLLSVILLNLSNSYFCMVPLLIGAPIYSQLRSAAGIGNYSLFNYMGIKTQLFILIYYIFLGGFMAYFLSVKPDLIGNHVIFSGFLGVLPLILVSAKAERQIFAEMGEENA